MRRPLVALLALSLCTPGRGRDEPGGGKAPLLEGLGSHTHPVTTTSEAAQRYFDQGLTLCFAFNHPEAIRSFEEATKLDPNCAMAYWGVAFALGTNINMPMVEDAEPKALAALRKASELAAKATPREQAYVAALATRYAEKPPKDRAPLHRAFADAMREVVKKYPDDLDAATLFAEALMDTMPWDYWTADGKPKPETEEVLATLDAVLKRHPDHPGALHYYIHAVEASPNPERGLPAAQRLRDLIPAAGHLVHMPSHIYLRVGNYHEASRCNERAVAADEAYINRYKVKSSYPPMYFSHNIYFLSYSTGLEGRRADSIRAARKAAAVIPDDELEHMPVMQEVKAAPLVALARFGCWDELLREPKPDDCHLYLTAMYHYGRGLAFVRKRQPREAEAEMAALEKLAGDKAVEALETPNFPGVSVIRVARTVLAAEAAGLRGETDARLRGLEEAVGLQDKLPYMEPPYWYFPIRQLHGAALVEVGRLPAAEKVYREDLKRHPENGWSLFGLLQCLRSRGAAEVGEVQSRLRDAWRHADTTLTASSF